MMDVTDFKGLAAASIWLASALGGILPFILKQRQKTDAKVRDSTNAAASSTDPNGTVAGSTDSSLKSDSSTHLPPSLSSSSRSRLSSESNAAYGSTNGHSHKHRSRCHFDVDRFLSLGNMLGAGIFLGGGLMHLLPESSEGLLSVQKTWSSTWHEFPLAFFLAGIGFFTILLVEEATIAITTRRNNRKAAKVPKAASDTHAHDHGKGMGIQHDTSEKPATTVASASASTEATVIVDDCLTTDDHGNVVCLEEQAKAKRQLQRTLVQGLTPRVALMPVSQSPAHHHHRHPILAPIADDEKTNGVGSIVDCSSSVDSDVSDADSEYSVGPIQSFLNAAYDSPSPFPTLAERHQQQQRKRRHHHAPPQIGPSAHGHGHAHGTPSEESVSSSEDDYEDDDNLALGSSLPLGPPLGSSSTLTNSGAPRFNSNFSRPLQQPLLSSGNESSSPRSASPFHVEDTPPKAKARTMGFNKTKTKRVKGKKNANSNNNNYITSSSAITKPIPTKVVPHDHHHHHHHDDHAKHDAHTHDEHGHGHGGHGHGHGGEGHSHINISGDTSYIVAYLLVLALSFHSIFEGIALGTQENMSTAVSLFIAIIAHSPLAGFALGVSLVKSRATPRLALTSLFLFTITTPIGTILGLLMSYALTGTTLTLTSCIFQAFSAGTFLFVCMEEIIPKEMAMPKDKTIKLGLCLIGFLAMSAIKIFDNDGGDDDHD